MDQRNVSVGKYQIEKTLAHAPYSVLSVGKEPGSDQRVIMKCWATASAITAREQERIQADVTVLQDVRHAHLLPIREVHTSAQGVFLVSEYPTSGLLKEYPSRHLLQSFSLPEALSMLSQIGQALSTLHQHGIIHGNLTPQAIFFTERDNVQLGDFQVKSILECIPDYRSDFEESVPRCCYMAPEEFSGIQNAQSDQYALGVLAYLTLTGHLPFSGSARATLFQKHLRDQPQPLATFRATIPLPVEKVILKALAKHPDERHSNVQAFLDALEEARQLAIASQETLEHTWGIALPGQESLQCSASGATAELEPSSSATAEWETLAPPFEPITAATWSRTRVRERSPVATAKPVAHKQPATPSGRVRRRRVLLSLIFLLLLLVCTAGGWILFSNRSTPPQRTLSTTSNLVLPTPTSPQATVAPIPTMHLTPPLSPTPAASLPTATASVQTSIIPFLDCVTSSGNNLVAHFGFQNPNAFTVMIPLGTRNMLRPSNLNGSQPTSFAAGSQHNVFQVTFSKHQSANWSLDHSTAAASSSSPRC